jgi:hypothetical protein
MDMLSKKLHFSIRVTSTLLVLMALLGIPQVANANHGRGDLSDFGGFPGRSIREAGSLATDTLSQESVLAQQRKVVLVGHADPGGGFNADVVGHRGFAYLGSWGAFEDDQVDFCPTQGVRVFDVRKPSNPMLVATFGDEASEPDLAGTWTEKVIVRRIRTESFKGDLAAVSIQPCAEGAFAGFGLWDVTDPTNPQRLALYEATGTFGSHEIWLQRRGNHAYVYTAIPFSEFDTSPDGGTTPGRADFRIVDVSDPTNPTDVGEWGAWAKLGLFPFHTDENGVERANFVHSVIGRGQRAYLSYWDLGTVILDVSDPANPIYLGRTEFAPNEEGNAHSSWLGKRSKLLIQTDEDFDPSSSEALETAWGYARFFDISDPSNPVQISTFKLPSTTQFPPPKEFHYYSVHDPKVRGRLAYFSWYSEGVVILNISRPANPRLVAQFIPEPAADPQGFFAPPDVEFPFVWGVFPYRERLVLVSDINSGLWIIKLRGGDDD